MNEDAHLSRSVEDYLKVIYGLTEQGESASTSAIADLLEVQPASVSGMVKRLAESGLAEHAPYRGVRLTSTGRQEALRIIRRHRILETYLHDRLGLPWEEVHGEAERLEHAASDRLIERMAAALEDPRHDPHGAPIPTATGEIEAVGDVTLADTVEGGRVEIRAVQDEDSERLRYMEAKGLVPGVVLSVVGREPFHGPVTVRIGGQQGRELVVGYELAARIYVTRA